MIIDGAGNPQPWLTYPAIEFLKGLDLSDRLIFEFGAGASTLFWAKRARFVTSVELDEQWFDKLRQLAPSNVDLHHEPDGHRYADRILEGDGRFDLIVVDGAERRRCARNAIRALKPGGAIVLDNADWYPNTADDLMASGLIEARFAGFSPLNAFTSTTSIFFSRAFNIPTSKSARQAPVGGVQLPAPAPDD